MKAEYLLLNFIILLGPLALSFDRKVRYFLYWRHALLAIVIVMIPFIVWDVHVTERHWWFNESYISGISIFNLPLEEWMFFITVPFACLFVWQIIVTYNPVKIPLTKSHITLLIGLFFTVTGLLFIKRAMTYSGLACFAVVAALALDDLLHTGIFTQRRTYLYLSIVTALMILFNGYLTARPVVLYNADFQTGLKLFTIPVEDFFYGYGLITTNTIVFEAIKRKWS